MNHAQLELLAITLFKDYVGKNKSTLERVKLPVWTEIGEKLRNEYRMAVMKLIRESVLVIDLEDIGK